MRRRQVARGRAAADRRYEAAIARQVNLVRHARRTSRRRHLRERPPLAMRPLPAAAQARLTLPTHRRVADRPHTRTTAEGAPVTHPAHLHATAALWSLTRALQQLTVAAHAHDQAAADADLGTLQAWRPGTAGHGSGHGDTLLEAITRHTGRNEYRERFARTMDTAAWIAQKLLGDGDPLVRLRYAVPTMTPLAADNTRRWIQDEDTAVRRLLGEPDDHQPLPGVACPACDQRTLHLRTSAPPAEQVIECAGRLCVCIGQKCGCGMTVPAAGVGHIWPFRDARLTRVTIGP